MVLDVSVLRQNKANVHFGCLQPFRYSPEILGTYGTELVLCC